MEGRTLDADTHVQPFDHTPFSALCTDAGTRDNPGTYEHAHTESSR